MVDGAHVTATLEHPFGDPDELIHLTLTSDKRVELGVVVMGSSGTEGARVPDPPRPVAHRSVELVPDRTTGKATAIVAIRLHNARGASGTRTGRTPSCMSPKAGDRLQALVDRWLPIPTGEILDMDTDTQKLFATISRIIVSTPAMTTPAAATPRCSPTAKAAVLTAFTRPMQDRGRRDARPRHPGLVVRRDRHHPQHPRAAPPTT